ncbi:MAG: enoyl-CoA hydratase/isomerase family protein [Pseudomonadota bacterium]
MPDDRGVLEIERSNGVAIATLSRPPANALTAAFLDHIRERFAALEADPQVSAVVLTGAGRALSAGMDLKTLPGMDLDAQAAAVDALNAGYGALYGFQKPLVAAVNGAAVAGGLFFALCADHRLAALGAGPFSLPEVRVGAPFPIGALEIVRAELSPAWARRLLLAGGTIDAAAARDAGILDDIVASETLIDRAVETAAALAASPPAAYAAIKRQLRKPVLDQIARTLAAGDDPHRRPWLVADPAETVPRILGRG